MVHLLSQLDPMVWLMMVVVAIGFVVAAVVLVELLPGAGRRQPETAVEPGRDGVPAESSASGPPGDASPSSGR